MAVAVVTGGASGIGWAVCERLLRDGWRVVIADVDEAGARARLGPERLSFRPLDVRDRPAVAALFPAVARELGAVDLLVNSAGLTTHAPLERFPWEDWRRVLDVDLDGAFLCLQAAGRLMLEQGSGVVVNITSVAAERGAFGRAPYCVAKAGLAALTRVASTEWAARGVRVVALGPGYVETPLVEEAIARGAIATEDILPRIPAGRMARPEELAAVVAFLASPDASYLSGQTLYVDGGFLADYGVTSRPRPPAPPAEGA